MYYVKLVKKHMCSIFSRHVCESLLNICESDPIGVNNPNHTTMFEWCVWLGVDPITSMQRTLVNSDWNVAQILLTSVNSIVNSMCRTLFVFLVILQSLMFL